MNLVVGNSYRLKNDPKFGVITELDLSRDIVVFKTNKGIYYKFHSDYFCIRFEEINKKRYKNFPKEAV